eukprot:1393865-Rhodomonas_salina.2
MSGTGIAFALRNIQYRDLAWWYGVCGAEIRSGATGDEGSEAHQGHGLSGHVPVRPTLMLHLQLRQSLCALCTLNRGSCNLIPGCARYLALTWRGAVPERDVPVPASGRGVLGHGCLWRASLFQRRVCVLFLSSDSTLVLTQRLFLPDGTC